MSKTTFVQPICRTNFLSRVNRFGVVVKSTDLKGDVKIYDAVKYPEKYVAEMLLNGFGSLASIEVARNLESKFLTFWSNTGKADNIVWSSFFDAEASPLKKVETAPMKKAA